MKASKVLPVLLAAIGLAASIPSLRAARASMSASEDGASESAWVRYVMVAFGGFRGVLSEILWIRAGELQEDGRYFELVQLADWITALDPKAIDAWVFNAWNLAYNVPAMMQDGRTRLDWVKSGIALLRDKAIPANPSSPRLYRELGWMYQDKIGSNTDSASKIYKLALAEKFSSKEECIGDGPAFPLDASVVAEIEGFFGPLDWRIAHSHALYWAWRAVKHAPSGFERAAAKRMIRQCALSLVGEGTFTGDVAKGVYSVGPRYSISSGLVSFCLETCREDPAEVKVSELTLERLVQLLHDAGQGALEAEAQKGLGQLRP